MTRPRKATVDYFPHYCEHGKTMFVLEETFGIPGYYFWFRLLELLGSTEGHSINCNDPAAWRFLMSKTRSTPDKAEEILSCLADMKAIDPELWQSKIIWCQNFVDGVKDAYRNRAIDIPMRPDILRKKPISEEISPDILRKKSANEMKLDEMKLDNKDILSTDKPVDPPNGFKISHLAQLWNEKAPNELAKVNLPFKRNPTKLKKLNSMLILYPDKSWWAELFARIHGSPFLCGINDRGWKANFDFVVSKADEISDGKYFDNGSKPQKHSLHQTINNLVAFNREEDEREKRNL